MAESSRLPEAFDCPRCATSVAADHYGPCDDCCRELRAASGAAGHGTGAEPGEGVGAAYEPKMHVTPNAVALKDND